jgi:hypothetical protein
MSIPAIVRTAPTLLEPPLVNLKICCPIDELPGSTSLIRVDSTQPVRETDFTYNFRFEGSDVRVNGREAKENHARGSGKSAGASVWIDVSPFSTSSRYNTLGNCHAGL